MSDLERLLELERFIADGLSNSTGIMKYRKEYQSLKSKLEESLNKTKLFDSLLVENQTILDTISQVKIANQMYVEQIKQLKKANENLDKQFELKQIEIMEQSGMIRKYKSTLDEIKTILQSRSTGTFETESCIYTVKLIDGKYSIHYELKIEEKCIGCNRDSISVNCPVHGVKK